MAYESIKVDIIPGAENEEVLHFSQFDNKRPFFIELFNGADEFIPDQGMSLTLECRKRDGNIVIISNSVITDNVAEFSTTEQLTACYGDNEAEIKIVDENDLVIGSANFIINVEKSPTCGGLVSESEIDNLTQQIEDIAQEVIGEDYYNKTEVDDLLDAKADVSDLPDMSQYYDKSETNTLLNGKADASTTYTKTEVNNALALKANTSDLATVATTGDYDDLINKPSIPAAQIQSDYAQADNTQVDYIKNKPDIAGMIAAAIFNILPVGTASGNLCSFDTEIAGPLQGLTAEIVASGGNGTPATPIPIVGHSALNLDVNGDAFTVQFGQTVYGGTLDVTRGKVRITHAGTTLNGSENIDVTDAGLLTQMFVVPAVGVPNVSAIGYDSTDLLCNAYTACAWSANPWNVNNSISYYVYDGTLRIKDDACADVAAFKAYLANNPVTIVYPLATPIEIDVSELSVDTIVGVNNITSDGGGDVTAQYKDTIQHYIDSRI